MALLSPPFLASGLQRRGARGLVLAVAISALLGAISLAVATPSQAVISTTFGVQQRAKDAISSTPLQYHGGPVITASDTYAVYWDPVGAYRSDWLSLIDRYFRDVGADSGKLSNVFSVNTQYTGPAGTRATYQSTFRGAYSDVDKYPTSGCSEITEAVCLTDAQIQSELKAFIEANHLPTGLDVIYYLLTPPGVNVCTDGGKTGNCSNSTGPESEPNGFCGYHSAIDPGSPGAIVYGVQPWIAGNAGRIITQLPLKTTSPTKDVIACQNGSFLVEPNQTGQRSAYGDYETGLADVIINDLSIEQSNIVTDPYLTGWYQTSTKAEQGDVCQRTFNPGPETLPQFPEGTHALNLSDETISGNPYYLQWAFDSTGVTSGKGMTCWEGTELIPHFTSPNPVNPGDIVGFDANESSFTLDANTSNLAFPGEEPFTAPLYRWEFGDGSSAFGADAASVYHSYGAPGSYTVTLTVTDSGANTAQFSKVLTVSGPSGSGAGGSGGSSSGGSGQAQGATQSGPSAPSTGSPPPSVSAAGGKPAATPNATAAVVSRSLRKMLRSGLVVRYSVNERVTGHFEVLLATSIAHRIGVHGPQATGLAAGTPPQTMIGRAILVTTAGGRNALTIQLSKSNAAHLRRLHNVSLLLRLVVRNGANRSATVLVTASLSH